MQTLQNLLLVFYFVCAIFWFKKFGGARHFKRRRRLVKEKNEAHFRCIKNNIPIFIYFLFKISMFNNMNLI